MSGSARETLILAEAGIATTLKLMEHLRAAGEPLVSVIVAAGTVPR
jgi:hypothetical protein